jgi:hypothetical protein
MLVFCRCQLRTADEDEQGMLGNEADDEEDEGDYAIVVRAQ